MAYPAAESQQAGKPMGGLLLSRFVVVGQQLEGNGS